MGDMTVHRDLQRDQGHDKGLKMCAATSFVEEHLEQSVTAKLESPGFYPFYESLVNAAVARSCFFSIFKAKT